MKSYSNRSIEIPKSKIYIIGLLALVLLFGAAFQYTKNIHSLGDVKEKELLAEYGVFPVLSDTIISKMNSSSKYR